MATVTRTRAAIPTQLREFFAAAGIDYTDTYTGGVQVFVVDGIRYTPAGAAERYLPGGFDGAYGQAGTLPRYRVGQRVNHTQPDGANVALVVVDLAGARRYSHGYVALCRDAAGSAQVIPA